MYRLNDGIDDDIRFTPPGDHVSLSNLHGSGAILLIPDELEFCNYIINLLNYIIG